MESQRVIFTIVLSMVCAFGPISSFAQRAPAVCGRAGTFAVFAVRRLDNLPGPITGEELDRRNREVAHEQLFFCRDGVVTENIGFTTIDSMRGGHGNVLIEDVAGIVRYKVVRPERFDAERMRQALGPRQCVAETYDVLSNSCQHFADRVRSRYYLLSLDGEWIAHGYRCDGVFRADERVRVTVDASEGIVATKVTGDPCVPAGAIAFRATLPASALLGEPIAVRVTIGAPDSPASENADAIIVIRSADSFHLGADGSVRFRRIAMTPKPGTPRYASPLLRSHPQSPNDVIGSGLQIE